MKKVKYESPNNKVRFAFVSPVENACSIFRSGTKATNKITGNPIGGQERKNKTPLKRERSKSFFLVITKQKYGNKKSHLFFRWDSKYL